MFPFDAVIMLSKISVDPRERYDIIVGSIVLYFVDIIYSSRYKPAQNFHGRFNSFYERIQC